MPYRSPAPLALLLLPMLLSSGAHAQGPSLSAQEVSDGTADAQMRVDDAIPVVGKMKQDPHADELLQKAKGIVIVPHYLQAALVFGGRGGAGVLLVKQDGQWRGPVFYRLGGGTFGAQIGGTKGAMVLLLMSDKAVDAFENKASTWSMSAGAGLNAISYSKQTPDAETLSDVIAWSDMKGLFGGAEVGASKVTRDVRANQIYYNNRDVTAQQILSGTVTNPNAKLLIDVLSRT